MLTFTRIRKLFSRYFADMRWYSIVLALVFYGVSSWLLLFLANEDALLNGENFVYWLIVTGSTVGYGDLSPTTPAGKYIVSFYVIPLGLSIFALVIGRIAAWVSTQWQKGVRGLKNLELSNHIVVIGWNGQRTMQLLELLLKEKAESPEHPEILLCVRVEMDNPMPGKVEFVRVSSFNRDEEMDRACIADAKVIVMDNPEDDLTMTTALYCNKRNPDCHKIAYFKDESLVNLIQQHCPNVECTPSVAVEMLAKSAFDPGSSVLHYDLLSLHDGQAQYSITLPTSEKPIAVSALFVKLKQHYDATFIGYQKAGTKHSVSLNPGFEETIEVGDKIFYIAPQRIQLINWKILSEA